MSRRFITVASVLVLLITVGCGSSQSVSSDGSTSSTVTPSTSTTESTTSTTEPSTSTTSTTEPTTSTTSTTSTTDSSTTTTSASALDAICTAAYEAYHSGDESESSDPLAGQVKANNLLSAAAEKLREAGADDLAAALEKQVEAGKALAAAEVEGQFDTTSEFNAYDEAGNATAAAASAAGAPECERLGGL